ncbi:MAG: helix-hairpin-helix domain-containing protein [Opitutaceae bacterium]
MLVIVLWICLGLVALTLYFADSMSSSLRAADNRVTEVAARQALAGGIRYAGYVLKTYAVGGAVPEQDDYQSEALPVGDASFWFIGRNNDEKPGTEPHFALVDESSKLNLNTITAAMLQALPLPDMTPDLAAAIVAWRNAGAQGQQFNGSYASLDPPRSNKGAAYETTDELRLIYGATLDVLFGEDTNRNGVLDHNEDDSLDSAPRDDGDGQLLAGLLEYVTVYTRQPATGASGQRRLDIRTAQTRAQLAQRLTAAGIAQQRAQQIAQRSNANNPTYTSVAAFMVASQMTAEEFALVHTEFTAADGGTAQGLVNVNTASEAVLAAIPGIGPESAPALVAFRLANRDALTSFHWLTQILTPQNIQRAGPLITDQSYQFSADVAAVGNNGRGYCREKVIFDTSAGTPRIVYRQDMSAYGWALGAGARTDRRNPRNT